LFAELKRRSQALKGETLALLIASRDPRLPWYVKIFLGLLLAYSFSPIDLIPDFVPVLGYLDDLIIVPLGISLALRMIPAEVMADARRLSDQMLRQGKPISRVGAGMVVVIWLVVLAAVVWSVVRAFQR